MGNSMADEIFLPADTEVVRASDIPTLIAEALFPSLLAAGAFWTEATAQDIGGVLHFAEGKRYYELSNEERKKFKEIQVLKLEKTYLAHLRRALKAGMQQGVAGGLKASSRLTRSPYVTDDELTDTYVAIEDFQTYVGKNYLGMKVRLADNSRSPAPVVAVGASGGDETWKEKARECAHEIIKRDVTKDLFPSQQDIANEIAKLFRRDGVMGADGKPLAGTYIKRHALKGISSAQKKQLSTAISQGK
jgi:hypothetical protein